MSKHKAITFSIAAFILVASGSLRAEVINRQVFRITLSNCGLKHQRFGQTGFYAEAKGTRGIVTALHGVAGCQGHQAAVQEDGNRTDAIYIDDLTPMYVDRERDVVFLRSDKLESTQIPPLQASSLAAALHQTLTVIGYPQGVMNQQDNHVTFHAIPRRKLRELLPPNIQQQFTQRRSPDPEREVLNLEGHIQPGHSGAPILDPQKHVIGVANGGLAGGFVENGWAIPWTEINWQEYRQSAVNDLFQYELTSLFATPFDSGDGSVPAGNGAKIVGKIIFNNAAASVYTKAYAVIRLIREDTLKEMPIDFQYDNQSGNFTISNVPSGKYKAYVRLEAGYPFFTESGGDFSGVWSGLNDDIAVAPHDEVIKRNLNVRQVIHLIKPLNNQETRTSVYDDFEVLRQGIYAPSADVFAWDPVPGAAYYKVNILLMSGDKTQPVSTHTRIDIKEYQVVTTEIRPQLRATGPSEYYSFSVNAFNAQNEAIGHYSHYYTNGSGGWFEFRIQGAAEQKMIRGKRRLP